MRCGRFSMSVMLHYIVHENLTPLTAAAVIISVISLVGKLLGISISYSAYSFEGLFLGPSLLVVPVLLFTLWTLWTERPARPINFVISKFSNDWRGPERIYRGLPILVVFPVFFSVFTSYKASLGHIVPFYFDPYARQFDQLLHGGDAWLLLSKFLHYPWLTAALNFTYNVWYFLMLGTLWFCAFLVDDHRLRSQYLTAFLLCWFLIGVVAATALSSAGPCYYKYFFSDPSFDYISVYLRHAADQYPVSVVATQQYVLDTYINPRPGFGEGISAAPSMHVSMATLLALFLGRFGKTAIVLGWSYCIAILIASVHLGWHYAIDGYLAILLTTLIWIASAEIANFRTTRRVTHQSVALIEQGNATNFFRRDLLN
jgi:hypothetical protein